MLGIFRYLLAKDIGSPAPGQHAGDHGAAATEHQRLTQPLDEQIQFFWSWNSSTQIYMKDLSYKICSHLAGALQGSLVYGESCDPLPV